MRLFQLCCCARTTFLSATPNTTRWSSLSTGPVDLQRMTRNSSARTNEQSVLFCWCFVDQSTISAVIFRSSSLLFGLILTFFGQRFASILHKWRQNWSLPAQWLNFLWWFEVVLEATWRMLMFLFTELSILKFSLQCTFLLTWSVLSQMSWEWNPQAPPLFYGTRWAWDPWGPLQTLREILWFLLYQPITNSVVITLFKRQKLFFWTFT